VFCLGCALPGFAQGTADGTSNPTTTIVLARTGVRLDSPHVGTYHYLEVLQLRGKWVYPDIGYSDFGRNNYRHDSKRMTLFGVLFFDQTSGPAGRSARYLMPWTMLQFRFTPKFTNETVYFVYLPLNDSARIQQVPERTKFEYALEKPWKVGAGYGGYKYGDAGWQRKPFVTATISTRAGAFELWLQRMPGGAQVQFRYMLFIQRRAANGPGVGGGVMDGCQQSEEMR
jgi:hypothetical protein